MAEAFNRVLVFCRERPWDPDTATGDEQSAFVTTSEQELPTLCPDDSQTVRLCDDSGASKKFVFDQYFDPSASQLELYSSAARPIIEVRSDDLNAAVYA